jgi:hypothetical protein
MTVTTKVYQCLSTIKGIEAQLSNLSINFEDTTAKQLLHESMHIIEDVKKDLEARMKELEIEEFPSKTT